MRRDGFGVRFGVGHKDERDAKAKPSIAMKER
jgi:hypothetical protein